MRKANSRQDVGGLNLSASVTVVALAVLVLAGATGSSFAQEADVLRIDVTLDDFSFSPEALRIPAGRQVTLVIRNVGKVAHEFMAGRDVQGNDFEHDLFADLHVNIEQVDMADAGHAEHNEDADHDADAGHDADVGHAEQAEQSADEDHAHDEGHAHGTMVEAQAGQTFLMTFTLPEDRRGEWTTGCFLSGHYEAGMHGTLTVE